MIHDRQRAQISQKQDRRNIYANMKTIRSPDFNQNGSVHALGHMTLINYTSCAQLPQIHCGEKLTTDKFCS